MDLTININLDNAAFGDDGLARAYELATIFAKIRDKIARSETDGKVIESNGNTCGEWRIEE